MTKDTLRKITFGAPALKKAILHSLVFGQQEDFQMAGGSFGGEVTKKHIIVHRSFAGTSGTEDKLSYSPEDYVRAVEFDGILSEQKMFVIGWYVSFKEYKKLFSETNRKTHLGYQQNNPNAFVMVITPLNIETDNLRDILLLYRLKDASNEEFKETDWQILDFEIVEKDEKEFLDEIKKAKEVVLQGATGFLFSNAQLDLYLEESSLK